MSADADGARYCCECLMHALTSEDVEPLLAVDESGVLYVWSLDADGDETDKVYYPVYFCPFCGTQLQTEHEVEAKTAPPPSHTRPVLPTPQYQPTQQRTSFPGTTTLSAGPTWMAQIPGPRGGR